MAKLPRTTQKIFGKNAPENQITTFGSIKAGTPVYTQSASQIMNSAFEGGWSEAVEDDYAPYRQDRNAVDTAITQQLGYLFQDGIPEWDSGTTYYKGSVVKVVNGNALTFYKSIADNNTASVNTTASWHKMLDINASNQIVSPSINTPIISGGSMSNGTFSDPTFSGTVNIPLASQSSSTDSTIAASIGWVNNPSLSSNVLHKTGNESASGEKGFQSITIGDTSEYKVALYKTSGGDLEIAMYDQNNSAWMSSIVINKNGSISLQPSTSITAPTPATSDNSTKVATTAYVQSNLSSYALDSNVVKLTGDQTIDGIKTFKASTITVNKPNMTKGTNPSSALYWQWFSCDKNGTGDANCLGKVVTSVEANGNVSTKLVAYKNATGTTNATIGIYYPASGDAYTSAPTPVSSDNSTKIATTAFVKSVLSSSGKGLATYSKKESGYYKFTNGLIIQWGYVDSWSGYKTITFSTPFDSTKYRVSVLNSGPTGSAYPNYKVHTKTTTDMELASSTSGAAEWIAVGY